MNLPREILRHILVAQRCSDSAKGVTTTLAEYPELSIPGAASQHGWYAGKDEAIEKALRLIDSAPYCGISYYAVRSLDQNGHKSNVIYFTIRLGGKRYQISFHNFKRSIRFAYAEPMRGMATHWDKKVGGSREAACRLAEEYFS